MKDDPLSDSYCMNMCLLSFSIVEIQFAARLGFLSQGKFSYLLDAQQFLLSLTIAVSLNACATLEVFDLISTSGLAGGVQS
jgi:hypothetical protein